MSSSAADGSGSDLSPSCCCCCFRCCWAWWLLGTWPLVPAAIALGVLLTLPREGKAIGRVDPGFIAGEDFIFQDRTGLIAVDFRSMLGIIGNLFAGWKRVPKHFEQPSEVSGWFRRGMSGYVILRELNSTSGRLRARPLFWQILICLAVIAANIWIVAAQ